MRKKINDSTFILRLPLDTKLKFMAKAYKTDKDASEYLRELICKDLKEEN